MADYENLLDSIDAVIKSNNRREITGQILQNTLHQIVGSLGENYQLAGFATPTLDPNSPDQNVFYVTDEAGVYTNFDNITLGAGLSFLMWKNEEWTSKTLDIVTADWVDEHYVSKAFLRKVFQFFDEDGVEIFPNDTESVVDNIKAMCGLWTNEYLSALGLGEGSTIPTTLAALNDVSITYPLLDGQALVYDEQSNHWVNATIQSGVDMSVVWAALAGATNEQINISHLTTALNDYVTATSLATTLQSYVTTSALATELANYASQSWVETNYISKAFFNSLFQAQDVNGNAITPNNSGQTTIDRLKILVGAYTEQYLSALGLSSGGGGGGSSTLAGLNDVTITYPLLDGQALIYDEQSGHWVNGAAISMSAVWTALAAATSEQINSSHLTSALSGYVTTSALASELANYVTTSSLATTLADYVTTSVLTTTLADYGSKTWIDNNYVSKAFFNRLFQAFAPLAEGQTEPTQVEPNDTTTTIDNIKAMFGLWTEQYLSALGLSAGGGHTIGVLNDLNDVTITNPQNDQVLKYNNGIWVNAAAPSGASALSGLTDVAISSLADKDLLQWDYASGKWKNVVLSTAMSAYALASSIPTNVSQLNNDSGYITSAALSGYATQQWVGQQGYITGITSSMVTTALGYTPANSTALSDYVAKSGTSTSSPITGVLYIKYTDGLYINSLNQDLNIWQIVGNSGSWASEYGFNLQYLGTGSGNDNDLILWAHNGSGTHKESYRIHQDGQFVFKSTPYVGSTAVSLNGHTHPYLPLYNTGEQVVEFNVNSISQMLTIKRTSTDYSMIKYQRSSTVCGYLGFTSNDVPTYRTASGTDYTLIHSGNIGSQSVSYATKATQDGSGNTITSTYLNLAGGTMTGQLNVSVAGWGKQLVLNRPNGSGTWGASIRFCSDWNVNGSLTMDSNDLYIGNDGGVRYKALHTNNVSPSITSIAGYTTTSISVGGVSSSSVVINYATSATYCADFTQASGGSDRYMWFSWSDNSGRPVYHPNFVINLTSMQLKAPNVYATGGVTALSDERHKRIVGNTRLQVSDIAKMRAVRYIWDDGRKDNDIHVGSIAQDWQQILPEVVLRANNDEGTLSLQYGVAALISSITIARKVVNHEERIKALERENADLKQAYSFIKNAYDYLKMDYEQLKLKIA